MESARRALIADLPQVLVLARAARAEQAVLRGGSVWLAREARAEPLEPALAALITDPGAAVVVGCIDEVVVGYGIAVVAPRHDGSLDGVVEELYVEEGARAVGVGEAMVELIVDGFRARGCLGVDAHALPGHRATKNFFEEQGFVARRIVMHHSLVPEAEPPTGPPEGPPGADGAG